MFCKYIFRFWSLWELWHDSSDVERLFFLSESIIVFSVEFVSLQIMKKPCVLAQGLVCWRPYENKTWCKNWADVSVVWVISVHCHCQLNGSQNLHVYFTLDFTRFFSLQNASFITSPSHTHTKANNINRILYLKSYKRIIIQHSDVFCSFKKSNLTISILHH